MNARAYVVAANLVECECYMRGRTRSCVTEWINEVAEDTPAFVAARAAFTQQCGGEEPLSQAATAMLAEYGKLSYQLGVYVGLRVGRQAEASNDGTRS